MPFLASMSFWARFVGGFLATWIFPGIIVAHAVLPRASVRDRFLLAICISFFLVALSGIGLTYFGAYNPRNVILSLYSTALVTIAVARASNFPSEDSIVSNTKGVKESRTAFGTIGTRRLTGVMVVLVAISLVITFSKNGFHQWFANLNVLFIFLVIAFFQFRRGRVPGVRMRQCDTEPGRTLLVRHLLYIIPIIILYVVIALPGILDAPGIGASEDRQYHLSRIRMIQNNERPWYTLHGVPGTPDIYPFFQHYLLAAWFSLVDINPTFIFSLATLLNVLLLILTVFITLSGIWGWRFAWIATLVSLFITANPVVNYTEPNYKINTIILIFIFIHSLVRFLREREQHYLLMLAISLGLLVDFSVFPAIIPLTCAILFLGSRGVPPRTLGQLLALCGIIILPYVFPIITDTFLPVDTPEPILRTFREIEFPPTWIFSPWMTVLPLLCVVIRPQDDAVSVPFGITALSIVYVTMISIMVASLGLKTISDLHLAYLIRLYRILVPFDILSPLLSLLFLSIILKSVRRQYINGIAILGLASALIIIPHFGVISQIVHSPERLGAALIRDNEPQPFLMEYERLEGVMPNDAVIFPGDALLSAVTGRRTVLGRMVPDHKGVLRDVRYFFATNDTCEQTSIMAKYKAKYVLIGPFDIVGFGVYPKSVVITEVSNDYFVGFNIRRNVTEYLIKDQVTQSYDFIPFNASFYSNHPFTIVAEGETWALSKLNPNYDGCR